jgi:hypothetical protein
MRIFREKWFVPIIQSDHKCRKTQPVVAAVVVAATFGGAKRQSGYRARCEYLDLPGFIAVQLMCESVEILRVKILATNFML